jgi:glycosyltransferase involved in cell wall biosynthesis
MIALYIRELDIKGGTHKQLYYLADYLERSGVQFKILTNSLDYTKTFDSFRKLEDKIECIERKLSNNIFLKIYFYCLFVFNFRKALKNVKILNVHDQGLHLLFPFFFDKIIIWQINDLPIEFLKTKDLSIFNKVKKSYIKASSKLFVKSITVNVSKNKERVLNNLGLNSEVLYCGIEKVDINRNLTASLNRLKSKKINILTSGVFIPYRNYETTVEVVYELTNLGYDVDLNIIGSTVTNPQYAKKIDNLIKQFNLENQIKILGQVTDSMFLELHDKSDIFMFINIDQSWGLAVFEAMSCGLPVILSQSVGATEILKNNIDCLFVDPVNVNEIVNRIIELVNNSQQYIYLSNNGIDFANNYTWDKAYSSNVLRIINEFY